MTILNTKSFGRTAILSLSLLLAAGLPGMAQDVSETHLKAARAAIGAMAITEPYDMVLAQAAFGLKQELIARSPDQQERISAVVDEQTLLLAPRRADLEREAALGYAKSFNEQELNDIAAFYSSTTGQKLLKDGPIAMREVVKAADIWQRGVARDLGAAVAKALNPEGAQPAAAQSQEAAPAEGSQEAVPAEGEGN